MVMSSQEELDGEPLADLEARLSNLLADVSSLFDCSFMCTVGTGVCGLLSTGSVTPLAYPRTIWASKTLGQTPPPDSAAAAPAAGSWQ